MTSVTRSLDTVSVDCPPWARKHHPAGMMLLGELLVRSTLQKVATRVPIFMYLTDYRERTLKDVITQLEPGLFKKVTGLNVRDFELLCSIGVFNATSTYELIKCKSKMQDSDEWVDDEIDLPDELAYFSYTFFHFKVEPLDDCDGVFSHLDQTVIISPEALENDITILHELIHLHEFVINELPMYFHDMLFWALYKDLKGKIPVLDEIITDHAHLLTGSTIYKAGGLHDILFFLKSFDLDIRMGFPLGTVFAYGREEEFKPYSYKKNDG